jgi:acetyl-CoA carboxylase carboxyl transferase subunit alpha
MSPEGCASSLWRDEAEAPAAAEAMRLTADDLLRLKLVDQVVAEPLGGAHRDKAAALLAVGQAVQDALTGLIPLDAATLRARRREKFLAMGRETLG